MNELKLSPLILGLIAVVLMMNIAAIVISYESLSMARQVQADASVLGGLQEQVDRMRSEIDGMTRKMTQGPAQIGRPVGPPPSFGGFQRTLPPTSLADLPSVKRPPGGNSLQPAQADNPQAGSVTPQEVASHRKDLIDRNNELHQQDAYRYGNKLAEVYNTARGNPGPIGSSSESEKAFTQMLTQYPDANATGMVIAEKAMQAAGQANTLAVEQFYNLLQEKQDFASIVTDAGVEALPAIQTYLAHQYIQQGRTADAESLLQSLESGNSRGLVAVPGPKGDPEYRPVTEVVSGLRAQMPTQTQ